jgi:hypothetical protein
MHKIAYASTLIVETENARFSLIATAALMLETL